MDSERLRVSTTVRDDSGDWIATAETGGGQSATVWLEPADGSAPPAVVDTLDVSRARGHGSVTPGIVRSRLSAWLASGDTPMVTYMTGTVYRVA